MKCALFCLLGLLVGWFAATTFGPSNGQDIPELAERELAQPVETKDIERIRELEQRLSSKEAELVAARSELDKLHMQTVKGQSAEEAVTEEVPMNPFLANAQSIAAESSKAHRQEKLEKLKRSLDLNPEQLAVIEEYFAEEAEREAKMMGELFAGKSMEAIQAEVTETAMDQKYHTVNQLLKDVLTPEQLEIHEKNSEQEALERKEANAYQELGRLQTDFILNEDQKDTVFAIFYEKSYAVSPEDWEENEIDTDDPEFAIKSKALENERLLEELSDALTPEQLDAYRMKLENETEMLRKSMQMFMPASK